MMLWNCKQVMRFKIVRYRSISLRHHPLGILSCYSLVVALRLGVWPVLFLNIGYNGKEMKNLIKGIANTLYVVYFMWSHNLKWEKVFMEDISPILFFFNFLVLLPNKLIFGMPKCHEDIVRRSKSLTRVIPFSLI